MGFLFGQRMLFVFWLREQRQQGANFAREFFVRHVFEVSQVDDVDACLFGDAVYFGIASLAIFESVAPAVELDDEHGRSRLFLADHIVDRFLIDMAKCVHEVSLMGVAAEDTRELHLRKYVVVVADDAKQDAIEIVLDGTHDEWATAIMEDDLLLRVIRVELPSAMNRTSHLASDYTTLIATWDILREHVEAFVRESDFSLEPKGIYENERIC